MPERMLYNASPTSALLVVSLNPRLERQLATALTAAQPRVATAQYRVVATTSPAVALASLKESHAPELAIVDLSPTQEKSGQSRTEKRTSDHPSDTAATAEANLEGLRQLRSHATQEELPILALVQDQRHIADALNEQADAVLVLPFNERLLQHEVQRLLENRAVRASLQSKQEIEQRAKIAESEHKENGGETIAARPFAPVGATHNPSQVPPLATPSQAHRDGQEFQGFRHYASLFESAVEGIAVVTVDGRLRFANPQAYNVLGMQGQSVAGEKLRNLVHHDDRGRAQELWKQVRQGSFAKNVDLRVFHSDRSLRVLNLSFAPVRNDDQSVLVIFRDVTEERATEQELAHTKEFMESLIDASVDAIVAADMSGTIILFNQGSSRLFGRLPAEVLNRMNIRDLYPEKDASRIGHMIRSKDYGGPGRLEPTRVDVMDGRGEALPTLLSASTIYVNHKPVATCGIFTDLRDRLSVEERLEQAQQKLAMSEKHAIVAELAGTAAHEINQPLTSVLGYAELLKRQLPEGSSEYQAVSTIASEAERMGEIVRKIGQITRYETKDYVGGQRILDLERATAAPPPGHTNHTIDNPGHALPVGQEHINRQAETEIPPPPGPEDLDSNHGPSPIAQAHPANDPYPTEDLDEQTLPEPIG